MREILLTRGQVALVDDEDYERVNQYKWYAMKHRKTFCAVRSETLRSRKEARETGLPRRRAVLMHRFIMDAPDNVMVDHMNHNGSDSRKENLRFCTASQNNMNQISCRGETSKYKGVCWFKQTKKWMAGIRYGGKGQYLGLFTNEIDAAKAYDKKAIELFGEFALINFPTLDND